MKRHRAFRLLSLKRCALVLTGGMLPFFSLSGCDAEVRNTVLAGIQAALVSAMTAIVDGFFLAIKATTETETTPVVKAVFEGLTSLVA